MEINISEKKEPTLCLNMIVKNEGRIIERLLESVSPIIDFYCICDTGSTDNTKEIIKNFFDKKNINGIIFDEQFVNFAHNRNVSLKKCVGLTDYVLLMDADMILEIKPGFNKNLLVYDSYTILQGSLSFYYPNQRIIRNNGLYNYVGVTHEYVSTPQNNKSASFDKNLIFINDIGDGGSKSNKYERDRDLLIKGIEDEPKNDRYHFYLANTYHDNGHHELAIDMYKKRIYLGGWIQEIWYSYYRIGICYKKMNKIDQAIFYWIEAYNVLPNRIENLYLIIEHYRIINKCHTALAFYKMAKESLSKATNKDEYLFLSNDIYTYKLEYEYSIISCYLGIKNINDQLITIFNNCYDDSLIRNTSSNMKFYKDVLKPIFNLNMNLSINYTIGNKEDRNFNSSSSCIIPHNDGYLMNMRLVNYTIDNGGYYHNCDDHIITLNRYIKLTKEFMIVEEKLFNSDFDNRRYIGIEDVKIFNDNNKIKFIGTGLHKNGHIGICYGDYNKDSESLVPYEIKPTFNKSNCEKNWVYAIVNNETLIIYGWNPLQLCKINHNVEGDNHTLDLIRTEEMPRLFKNIRGSTCGFNYKDEIWFIVHLVSYESPRHYYHLFVVFDNNMKLLRYSAPFKFEGEPIEYSVGLIVEDSRVIVPYSVWDRTTKIAVYNKSYIDSKIIY